ncbi:MAG: hypothetical protein RLZZ546_2468 [Bacteroidota bacterium]|jgi:lysophospholipase L1-like esterase
MTFRTEFISSKSKNLIDYKKKILFLGSCFSENIGEKLLEVKFNVLINPFGTVFNAASIATLLRYCNDMPISADKVSQIEDSYRHHDFHSKYNNVSLQALMHNIQEDISKTKDFIQKSDVIFITFGTSWIYTLHDSIVSNCHKVSQSSFSKAILTVDQNLHYMKDALQTIFTLNPTTKVVFTLSPVRHIKDGLIENNRSKAHLLSAIHQLVEEKSIEYFPAYEIMMDDLRDYRFYCSDLIHPNEQGINYVWEKFLDQFFSQETIKIMEEISKIIKFENHRPTLKSKSYTVHKAEVEKKKEEFMKKYLITF